MSTFTSELANGIGAALIALIYFVTLPIIIGNLVFLGGGSMFIVTMVMVMVGMVALSDGGYKLPSDLMATPVVVEEIEEIKEEIEEIEVSKSYGLAATLEMLAAVQRSRIPVFSSEENFVPKPIRKPKRKPKRKPVMAPLWASTAKHFRLAYC